MAYELGRGTGPLRGLRVVEIAAMGPGPHACMLLADLGADVVRVERPGGAGLQGAEHAELLARGRPAITLDLKDPGAVATVLDLVETADALVEGFRPGVMERLGLGPEACQQRNPRLVYGRVTGWGQTGPRATTAGHELTYLALTGALDGTGQDPERPQFSRPLAGDFGGGSAYLVVGILAALLEARSSGQGQVVDAAIVDGVAHLNALNWSLLTAGALTETRGANLLDGGYPGYALYETSDGRHVAVAALEQRFHDELVERLELAERLGEGLPDRTDPGQWPRLRDVLTEAFRTRTRDEWAAVFAGSDACVVPVLALSEAPHDPHAVARGTYVDHDGALQPAPAPRFSRTVVTPVAAEPDVDAETLLAAWGVTPVG